MMEGNRASFSVACRMAAVGPIGTIIPNSRNIPRSVLMREFRMRIY